MTPAEFHENETPRDQSPNAAAVGSKSLPNAGGLSAKDTVSTPDGEASVKSTVTPLAGGAQIHAPGGDGGSQRSVNPRATSSCRGTPRRLVAVVQRCWGAGVLGVSLAIFGRQFKAEVVQRSRRLRPRRERDLPRGADTASAARARQIAAPCLGRHTPHPRVLLYT